MVQSTVVIADGELEAEIAPLGAELQRLTHRGVGELLWDGDPAWWTGRAPLLFPIVGGLVGDRYRHDGKDYSLPKHGFARRSDFDLVDANATSALFQLRPSADTRSVFPFEFRLDMRFTIAGDTLAMEAIVANDGAVPMPASFGYHPALRWPLPYGAARAEHRMCFAEAEPDPIRRVDTAGVVLPEPEPTPVDGRTLRLRDDLFERDAIIFDRLRSTFLVYGAPGSPALEIGFPDTPYLGIWMKPGADYVCVEPWQGHADPQGFAGDIADKPGILMFAPGEARRFRMSIKLRPSFD